MFYWAILGISIAGTLGLVALILWWAWRQETAGRFASTLDRRFAKDRPKPKGHLFAWMELQEEINRNTAGQFRDCDERVSALEETAEELDIVASNQSGINQSCLKSRRDLRARIRKLEGKPPLASDSSPDTETQADSLSGSDTSSKSLSHVSLDGKPTPLVRRGTSDSRSSPRNLGSKRAPSRAARTGRTPTVRA